MSLRVFENLIVNAVKYSHKPSKIRVKIDVIGNDAIVTVQNKGDSIPKEELSKIFDRFYRIEKSRSSTTGGSGLGLAIAKNIVELHGGTIWSECNGDLITFFVKFKCIN
jgi:signal transduction histidine kinase